MSSVKDTHSLLPSLTPEFPPRRVPALDELYAMTSMPDHREVIRGVAWAFYEQLVDSIPENANLHVDYDGKDLEIMGKGRKHEKVRGPLGFLVRIVAGELMISYASLGETTWKRIQIARGLEAD